MLRGDFSVKVFLINPDITCSIWSLENQNNNQNNIPTFIQIVDDDLQQHSSSHHQSNEKIINGYLSIIYNYQKLVIYNIKLSKADAGSLTVDIIQVFKNNSITLRPPLLLRKPNEEIQKFTIRKS